MACRVAVQLDRSRLRSGDAQAARLAATTQVHSTVISSLLSEDNFSVAESYFEEFEHDIQPDVAFGFVAVRRVVQQRLHLNPAND